MLIQIILGKYLKVGDIFPGSSSEYDRTISHFVVKGKHSSIGDTYRVAYFQEKHRLPMTIFDNSPIDILYKKYRRNNKVI